ncbi:MAG TPA: class I adenylate-forming enzyme family protein [Trebonia sp.]
MTFAQRWSSAVSACGDRPFLIFEGPDGSVSQWTYREFDEVVTRMGATLAAAGVRPGSSVHVVLRNCPAFVAIWLACARSGAWIVPADPTSTARDVSRQLDRVPAMIVVARDGRARRPGRTPSGALCAWRLGYAGTAVAGTESAGNATHRQRRRPSRAVRR